MKVILQTTIRVPKVSRNDDSSRPKTLPGLIKLLNRKYNIGFNEGTLMKELKEAIRMSNGSFCVYDYWERRLSDAADGRDDLNTILDEFQREAATLGS